MLDDGFMYPRSIMCPSTIVLLEQQNLVVYHNIIGGLGSRIGVDGAGLVGLWLIGSAQRVSGLAEVGGD